MSTLRVVGILLCATFPAFPQIDSATLRAKFGPPLHRETFTPRPGIEMVVDYASNDRICRIQLPPVAPGREPGVTTPQAIDEFLLELIPMRLRGKELRRSTEAVGAPSVSIVEYETLSIAESFHDRTRTAVTVTFTREDCRR